MRQITTMSSLLTEVLNLYLADLIFDAVDTETPYLFHPTSSKDTTRCLPSSQWSQTVKAAFLKHAGKATPPKTLRASFVTWIRDEEAAPDVLKAAATAMRHKLETANSDRYDKATHDRLTAAATQYVEKFARTFSTGSGSSGTAVAQED